MDFPILLTSQLREHLRALRKARGLTQAALGRLLGVGQARIAEIESNPGAVSLDQLMRVISALRASLVLRQEVLETTANPPDAPASATTARANKSRRDAKAPSGTQALREANPDVYATPASRRHLVIRPKKGSW